ncbi:MAG: DUF4270 domain-containing protein [Chlorobi bacterium]|nr:DUF4270 domain-containing protein [Chlorobiota bacterium]
MITGFVTVFLFSCEDEPTQIGLEFKNVLNQVHPVYTDTFSIFSSVETRDTLVTDHANFGILGDFVDPVFGRTRASFITQYRLSSPWEPGYNAEVDSMKIFFLNNGYYGNELTKQTINIYELLMDLDPDTTYYADFNATDSISEWPIGSATFIPTDSIIEVFLSKTYARRIIQDTADLHTQADFMKAFKGFYVNVSPLGNDGAFIRLNLLASETYIALYYHNDTHDNLKFLFYINSYAVRVNLFKHYYNEAPPATAIRYLDQGIEDTVIYAQGMGGVVSRLDIPGLAALRDSGDLIINSARLVFPLSKDDPAGAGLTHPDRIDVMVKNSKNQLLYIIDKKFAGDYYGGIFDDGTGTYSVNITRHLQDYIKGVHDYHTFYLVIPDQLYNPSRVVFNGRLHSNPLRLELLYTRN